MPQALLKRPVSRGPMPVPPRPPAAELLARAPTPPPRAEPPDPATRDDGLAPLLARAVAGRHGSALSGLPSLAPASGPLLQRYESVPSLVAWKRDTSHFWRSSQLTAIDRAIAGYHRAGTAVLKRAAFETLRTAIGNWQNAHPRGKRMDAVKALDAIRLATKAEVERLAQEEIGRKPSYKAYESAVSQGHLATAAAEAKRLLAVPEFAQEFNDYLNWRLAIGETDPAKLAVRFMTGHKKAPTGAAVKHFAEHSDLTWLDAESTKWMYDNVVAPLRTLPTFPDLLKHPQLLAKLAEHDPEDYAALVAATPALKITAAVRARMRGDDAPAGAFGATDALFAAALGGPDALRAAYSPVTIGGGGNPLVTAGLETPAKLMCHTLAKMFFDLFGIYGAQTPVDWKARVVSINEPLLTKPAGALRLAPGVEEGLAQKHDHPGNVLDSVDDAPTGRIFFSPAPGEPSHSYVTVDAGGESRSYDPVFGIAWTGDWRDNAYAGIADLFVSTGKDAYKAERSADTITKLDTGGRQPFTTRYLLDRVP